ncbi:MAG: DUF5611 family protein [Candidatus Methanoperedenaceae archaeon]|nr:DUF5611 family protein [Candidatus Methanoperedenaceae archaeon]MDW7728087.1 DUF5611 family protein [Candidatus Methanoperedens sp.]
MVGDNIQVYTFKRGFSADIERVREVLKANIPAEITENEGKYAISYGAFKNLYVWLDGRKLCVDSESEMNVSEDVAFETNKRYRKFLQEATGYTAKERLKKAKKEVGS